MLRGSDPRCRAPPIDVEHVVARGGAPVDVPVGLPRPPFDAREAALGARAVALDVVVAAAVATLLPTDRDEVLHSREDEDVRLLLIRVARQPLVGLARDRRRRQAPSDAEGTVPRT